MFSKYFTSLLINSCLCLSELTIAPSSDIEVNEGEPLKITCTASEEVDFFYPKDIPDLAATSSVSIVNEPKNGTSNFIFKRSKTVFGDSGWYGCIKASKNQPKLDLGTIYVTPDNFEKSDVKWVYVFVKSTEHLLVDIPFLYQNTDGKYYLFEEESDDVLLPCRPTSAAYKVEFYSFDNSKPIDSEYDPKRGIIIRNIKKDSPLSYYCIAVENNGVMREKKEFVIKITGETPTDKVPKFSTKGLTHMEIGKKFSVECLVRFWNHNNYFLNWLTPRSTSRTSKNLTTIENYSFEDRILNNRLVSLELTIENVTSEDFGEYQCRLYEYASVVTGKINLQPHERKHLDLSLQNPRNQYSIKNEKSYTWQINVDAYPIPELHWFDSLGKEIVTSWQFYDYNVNGECFSVYLTKSFFTADDSGIYTVFANNSEMKTISLNVVVYTPPNIIEEEQKHTTYSTNDVATFQCRAMGDPKPDITWEYLDEYRIVVENGSHFFEKIESWSILDEVRSSARTRISRSGYVSCEARNKYGKDSKLVKIDIKDPIIIANNSDRRLPTNDASMNASINLKIDDIGKPETSSEACEFRNPDAELVTPNVGAKETIKSVNLDNSQPKIRVKGPGSKIGNGDDNATRTEPTKLTDKPGDIDSFSLGTVNQEMIINEGMTITMQCSAPIDRFPDDIKWYNSTNLLATDGRVVIKETKEAPFHSSLLTIRDIQISDEGDFTCKGTAKNGSIVKNYYQVHVNASAMFSVSVILQLSIMLLLFA
ncbi:hemicentin-1-like [Cotesia glomerata]|uniref:hemicentin-1-like n=1 Tax=Cotesia glomerata TaxID=32391 RepID=UPI001D0277CA|nr:hemicentin-1-like [Cotesia glomerata]